MISTGTNLFHIARMKIWVPISSNDEGLTGSNRVVVVISKRVKENKRKLSCQSFILHCTQKALHTPEKCLLSLVLPLIDLINLRKYVLMDVCQIQST